MNMIRNLLAFTGAIAIVVILYALYLFEPAYHRFQRFDSQAFSTYRNLAADILSKGSAVEATVWKKQVAEGLTPDDVEEVMKSVANEHNIKNVGELPLYKQVEAMTGKPFRFLKIYMFCNALTAAKMVSYSDAYSAYLPCRVSLVKDRQGKLWLYSLNMDLMIYGGEPLPAALKKEALSVKKIILDIMQRGASGEF